LIVDSSSTRGRPVETPAFFFGALAAHLPGARF
jgi:hypothetical protein